jgi:hypothetical protein
MPRRAHGLRLLMAIGVLDTAVRMGLLTFVPFLLQAAALRLRCRGLALALFGGWRGRQVRLGWLGARLGVTGTVLATEGGTALAILAFLLCPLGPALVLLPRWA